MRTFCSCFWPTNKTWSIWNVYQTQHWNVLLAESLFSTTDFYQIILFEWLCAAVGTDLSLSSAMEQLNSPSTRCRVCAVCDSRSIGAPQCSGQREKSQYRMSCCWGNVSMKCAVMQQSRFVVWVDRQKMEPLRYTHLSQTIKYNQLVCCWSW